MAGKIPERMAHLKVDRRGYAIPYGVVTDADGEVHFSINDELIRRRSIRENLCSICGNKLFRGRWLVGGPLAAFHEHGAFIDPPMHSECAHYALTVCPYLAAPRYTREVGLKKADKMHESMAQAGIMAITIDSTLTPGRPAGDLFVALMTTAPIEILETFNLKPKQPYNHVEYWRHGRKLYPWIGERMVAEALREYKP